MCVCACNSLCGGVREYDERGRPFRDIICFRSFGCIDRRSCALGGGAPKFCATPTPLIKLSGGKRNQMETETEKESQRH